MGGGGGEISFMWGGVPEKYRPMGRLPFPGGAVQG